MKEGLIATDVMTRALITVEATESPMMAWELMRRAGIHHLLVVDAHGRLQGVVTREQIAARWSGGPGAVCDHPVSELVTGRRPRVAAATPIEDVAATMLDTGCDALPVVDPGGRLIGLITVVDVLDAVAGRLSNRDREDGGAGPALFRLLPVFTPEDEP